LLAFALGILDLCASLLAILLGLNPWRFVVSGKFYNLSFDDLKPSFHRDRHNGFDKARIAYPRPRGRSISTFLFPLFETSCLRLLPLPLLRNPQLPGFTFLDYPCCGVIFFAYSFCRLLVIVLFCYYMCPLHQRICWLLPLVQLLSLVSFFLSLPRDLIDEGRPKKRLLLVRRRRLLLSF
jgi:hypothetical protein